MTAASPAADNAGLPGDLFLLMPEWQGCGTDARVFDGAVAAAGALFGARDALRVEAPREERLEQAEGVLGLASIAERANAAREAVAARAPDRIVTVGGTCGVELVPVSWLSARYGGDLAVVWLDAHGDLNTPASSPSGHFHGMVLRTLLGEGPPALVAGLARPLAPAQVFLAGTRDLDPPEAQFVETAGIAVMTPAELATPDALCARIRAGGFSRAYVHVDLDVLDPAVFPDSLMRTPGGLTPVAAAFVIRALVAAFDVVGFSVVEFRERSARGLAALTALVHAARIPMLDRAAAGSDAPDVPQ